MDWDSYYEKFYEWATSTQIKKMSSLTSFGASAEISEVAQEYMDEKAAAGKVIDFIWRELDTIGNRFFYKS